MHWTRVSLFCLGAALLASSQPALAQVIDQQTGVVRLDDYSGSMALGNDGGSWMQVDRMSGNGVGFQSGYTRVGVRTKWLDFGESHFFTELNGTINDQKRLGTNLNLGYRTMYDGGVLGVHGGYDNYESNYGHNYQQGVVGAEYLHEWLDVRANGYMPFGDRDNFIGVLDPGTDLVCFGHNFGTVGVAQIERSLAGFDLEGGVPVPVATFLRVYGGTYFLTANNDDTWGVRSRVEARIGQGSALNFMVSDDDRFGTNLNFNATVWYGGGPSSPFKFRRDRSGWSRRYDPIRRAQTVQLAQDRETVNVPLVNTDTGNLFNGTWVDHTAPGGGNGTVENPFNSLPDSAPGSDYILVKRGAGNTVGNITLENNQHLYGEGQVYKLRTDRLGEVEIPDQFFDQTGPRPTLVPALANVPIVTLANNNEVINFNMTGGTASGIFGAFVQDFRIEHVHI
ncbi:MAG TPA: inverse autotransporter beta domain-containing protein, partial [Caulifigura sp.]|nr:inverse autotransporter beta domain-containing protein [Caulifigura sp.]